MEFLSVKQNSDPIYFALCGLVGMALFPAGRLKWDIKQVKTLFTIPTTLKWQRSKWKGMTAEENCFIWEFASISLELNTGKQTYLSIIS